MGSASDFVVTTLSLRVYVSDPGFGSIDRDTDHRADTKRVSMCEET